MPPSAIASGTISFGLVTIPIKVYSANRSSESIAFNLLHEKCRSRMKQYYRCPQCDEDVDRADMVKGYEFAKNQYVLFSKDELKSLEEKSTQSVEVTEFLPSEAIDPAFFAKTYYLGPDKLGARAYHLLGVAMKKMNRWALAKYATRGKQYLVCLRPVDNGLVMQQLHYNHEVRSMSELGLEEDIEIKEKELDLAILLAEQITGDEFRPEEYRDEVYDRLKAQIERKVEGEEVSLVPEDEPVGQVIDLMEALRRSLEASPSGAGEVRAAAKTARRKSPGKTATKSSKSAGSTKKRKAASR